MKKFLLVVGIVIIAGVSSQKAEAANFSFSIGGVMPPVVAFDTYTPGYYSYYTYPAPYYRNYIYFGSGHHYGAPPRHMGHGMQHPPRGHMGRPPGGRHH